MVITFSIGITILQFSKRLNDAIIYLIIYSSSFDDMFNIFETLYLINRQIHKWIN